MTIPVAQWPSGLPDRPTRALNEKPPNLRVESENDIGPPKTRRKATTGVRRVQVVYEVDEQELAIFEAFYMDTLKNGTLPYRGIHPRTGDSVAAMMKEPVYTPRGGLEWQVAFTMEIQVT